MALSDHDALCLNVLLVADVQAIRIDESNMTVYGLTDRGQASVELHPNCRSDQYLRHVREMLSEHVLDSPGGYPIYLRRWTRMGQIRDDTLARFLLLGEPEAVVAVVHAPGLTAELARRAWWAMPRAEHARRMLERPCVAEATIGKVLADYLVEYLPFEDQPQAIIDSICLVLTTGVADDAIRRRIWQMGRQRNAYHAAFLSCLPDAIPIPLPPHPMLQTLHPVLELLIAEGNTYAVQLARAFSAPGQAFLNACQDVLRHASSQEEVNTLLDALADYFRSVKLVGASGTTVNEIMNNVTSLIPCDATPVALRQLLNTLPELNREICAMLVLSCCSANIAEPVLSRTTAIGSLMRTKLAPVIEPVRAQIPILRSTPS